MSSIREGEGCGSPAVCKSFRLFGLVQSPSLRFPRHLPRAFPSVLPCCLRGSRGATPHGGPEGEVPGEGGAAMEDLRVEQGVTGPLSRPGENHGPSPPRGAHSDTHTCSRSRAHAPWPAASGAWQAPELRPGPGVLSPRSHMLCWPLPLLLHPHHTFPGPPSTPGPRDWVLPLSSQPSRAATDQARPSHRFSSLLSRASG